MKKFIVYLLVIVLAVSMGFAVFYLVRDNEVISISSASIYKDAGEPFQIDVNHQNKKSYTSITVSTSNASVVSYDKNTNTFKAEKGGVARINFRTTNSKFRNLWCDVIVGDGTMESPYYISTPEQLASIGMGVYDPETSTYKGSTIYNEKYEKYSSDKCYKLVSDIDVKDINEGLWVPLNEFSGRLDGNGFTISNINIDRDSYIATFESATNFSKENVGVFQKISSNGAVYNLKLDNVYASGIYDNFGTITAENKGVIERVEVISAYLSVETKVFGGLVANNITTESAQDDTYTRNIARIDRCSINMTAGKKIIVENEQNVELIKGMNGVVGGLVGNNNGGIIVYSYAKGEVAFGSDEKSPIIYGGLVGNNSYITLTKTDGSYTSKYQGGSLRDCYSDLKTTFDTNPTNSNSKFAGAIAVNKDFSESKYDGKSNKEIVHNYIFGVYYNKDNLNFAQDGITKGFKGIATFEYNSKNVVYIDEQKVVYGLTEAQMKEGENFLSHTTSEIEFDENGVSLGVVDSHVTWLFGSVWAIDEQVNDGKPYLNYQLVYIPEDMLTAGTPIILDKNRYTFEKPDVETTPIITSGTDGVLSMQVGQTYTIKVSPSGVNYTWKSSDTKIATVDTNGTVTAIKEGRVSITVSNKSGISDNVTIIITEAPVTITNLPKAITLKVNYSYSLRPKTDKDATISYMSEDESIATVTSSGVVKGKKVGSCVIFVIANDTVEQVKVNVIDSTSTTKILNIKFKVDSEAVEADSVITKSYAGKNITGKVTVTQASYDGENYLDEVDFKFFSTDQNILTIDDNGSYTIKGTGSVYIAITVSGSNYTGATGFVMNIVAQENKVSEDLKFNVSSYTLYVGQTFTIKTSGTTKTVKFSSVDGTVASVDAKGKVTANKAGTTKIAGYIVRDDGSYSYAYVTVSVKKVVQKEVELSPTSSNVEVGETVNFVATIKNGSSSDSVKWSISDSTIATIKTNSNKATVTMTKSGSLIVTASSGNVSATATIFATDKDEYSKTIYNANQLNNIRYHLDEDFVLASNIDLSGYIDWEPIGTQSAPFTGTLTSNGNYTISNMNVSGNYKYAGLFGYAKNAKIERISISNSNVTGEYVGAILGYGNNVGIKNCNVSNSNLTGTIATGGIAGYTISNSVISNCKVNGNVDITTNSGSQSNTKYVGGILGNGSYTSIEYCQATISGTIALGSATYGYAGGIVGYTNYSIRQCLVEANISAGNSDSDYAGGIAGYSTSRISIAVVRNSLISGYYAGGIGGALNCNHKATVAFSNYSKISYKKSDATTLIYSEDVSKVAVKENTTIKGSEVGGLFGVINSGLVKDCYTRATLQGANSKAIKGGFASAILSSGLTNAGGNGYVGIVENCYSACKFNSTGKNYSITASLVHNYVGSSASTNRPVGFCFNYLFDNDLDGNATYNHSSNIFAKDTINSKKSSTQMKTASTYTDKEFNSAIWNITSDYATLKMESILFN